MTWKNYLRTQALGVAAFNAICNASYTWFLWRDIARLEYAAVRTDLATTPIWIGLLSVLLGTPFIRKALADGRMVDEAGISAPSLAMVLPRNLALRGAVAAVVCGLLFALPLALVLPTLGDGAIALGHAIAAKIVITIAFSVIIVPAVVYATVADVPRRDAATAMMS